MHEYHEFTGRVKELFQLDLPDVGFYRALHTFIDYRENPTAAVAGFVGFADDWTPEFLPLPPVSFDSATMISEIASTHCPAPVFEHHGIAWHTAGRFGT